MCPLQTPEVALAECQLVKPLELGSSGTAVTRDSAVQHKDKGISPNVCSLDSRFSAPNQAVSLSIMLFAEQASKLVGGKQVVV